MKLTKLFIINMIFIILSACASPVANENSSQIEISDAWVRAVGDMSNMGGMSATALFVNIQNNADTPDMLIEAQSNVAEMVQIHLSEIDANGVASMTQVAGVEIPSHGVAKLKPGSYHVMLMGLTRDIHVGDLIEFTLIFENAGAVNIEARVREP